MTKKSIDVLVVEDREDLRTTIGMILEAEGYGINLAEDGYKAIQICKDKVIDIAFIDIKLPGMNGVEVFLEIKKISPQTKVFLISAYTEQALLDKAFKEEVEGFIPKPFDMEEIIRIINNIENQKFVVIVDDDKNLGELLKEKLKQKNYRVIYLKAVKQ